MDGEAIGAGAIGHAGRIMLTTDFGRTRIAERARAGREPADPVARRDGAARAVRAQAAQATRP